MPHSSIWQLPSNQVPQHSQVWNCKYTSQSAAQVQRGCTSSKGPASKVLEFAVCASIDAYAGIANVHGVRQLYTLSWSTLHVVLELHVLLPYTCCHATEQFCHVFACCHGKMHAAVQQLSVGAITCCRLTPLVLQ